MNRKNGFLFINKPVGITSSNLVLKIKKICKFHKIGHTGTLDRLASGLLILPINQYTCFSERFLGRDKKYRVKIKPGISTDSGDLDGEILERLDEDELRGIFSNRLKEIEESIRNIVLWKTQVPPRISALKKNGKRYSDLFRKNIDFEIQERPIHIYSVEIKTISFIEIEFFIHVSSGTYIRKIVQDLGGILQIPFTLGELERTEIGEFSLDIADSIEKLESGEFTVFDLDTLYPIPALEMDAVSAKKIHHGMHISGEFPPGEFLFTRDGVILAWCKRENETYSYLKVFV